MAGFVAYLFGSSNIYIMFKYVSLGLYIIFLSACSTTSQNFANAVVPAPVTSALASHKELSPQDKKLEEDFLAQVTILYVTKKRPINDEGNYMKLIDSTAKKIKQAEELCEEKGMKSPKFIDGNCYRDEVGFYCTQVFQCEYTEENIDKWLTETNSKILDI